MSLKKLSETALNPALSIAGFDPSGGAGVLADIQTFQQHHISGMAVITALTYQNERKVSGIKWLSWQEIRDQLEPLFETHSFPVIKIGVVNGLPLLQQLIGYLRSKLSDVLIIWDPVLQSSSGFDFIDSIDSTQLMDILDSIDIITPNKPEEARLCEILEIEELHHQFQNLSVLSKGGHGKGNAIDILYSNSKTYEFEAIRLMDADKHGTGCVLSAAITANLLKGKTIPDACSLAKKYVFQFLQSANGKLGKHYSTHVN